MKKLNIAINKIAMCQDCDSPKEKEIKFENLQDKVKLLMNNFQNNFGTPGYGNYSLYFSHYYDLLDYLKWRKNPKKYKDVESLDNIFSDWTNDDVMELATYMKSILPKG